MCACVCVGERGGVVEAGQRPRSLVILGDPASGIALPEVAMELAVKHSSQEHFVLVEFLSRSWQVLQVIQEGSWLCRFTVELSMRAAFPP